MPVFLFVGINTLQNDFDSVIGSLIKRNKILMINKTVTFIF